MKCWINKNEDSDKGLRPPGHDRPRRRGPGGPGGDRRGGGGGDRRGGGGGQGRPDNNSNNPADAPATPAS